MFTDVCLLISFIALGCMALSSIGLFLPQDDDHELWGVFAENRMLWNASAMLACAMFFVLAFMLIDGSAYGPYFDFSLFPFSSFLALLVVAPPLASYGRFDALRVVLVLMAVMSWMLFVCSVMLFEWGVVSMGVAWLALHCSAVALVIGRASLGR